MPMVLKHFKTFGLKTTFAVWVMLTSSLALAHVELRRSESEIVPIQTTIQHFDLITGTNGILYRGSHPMTEEDFRQMAAGGITTIVSLQGGDYDDNPPWLQEIIRRWEKGETPAERAQQRKWAQKYGIKYINLPVNSLKKLDAFNASSVAQAMRYLHRYEQAGGSIGALFIHCAHGADRTGLVVALYRVIYHHWTPDAAYAEWRRMGHTLVNMTTTWHLDEYFFDYLKNYSQEGHSLALSPDCRNNLMF